MTVTLSPSDTTSMVGTYFATLRLKLTSGAILDFEDADYQSTPFIELSIVQGAVESVA